MKENLFEYIKSVKSDSSELLDLIKFNISEKVYYYGDHFKISSPPSKMLFILNFLATYIYTRLINYKLRNKSPNKLSGLSASYHNFDNQMEKDGFNNLRMPHLLKRGKKTIGNSSFFYNTMIIQKSFIYEDYNYLISSAFLIKIKNYQRQIEKLIQQNSYKFLCVSNDNDFFARVYIKAFKKLKKPTFIIAHGGMPSMFDRIMDNQSDYVTMWGSKQIESFIKAGYDKNKFINTGHPFYNKTPTHLRFELTSILVITKSINGVCPLDKPHLEDRGNIIMYLLSIENTLKKMGIKSITLRPHPSENANWYLKFIDNDFFIIDKQPLSASLSSASLVIGPTSTTIIDAMAHEVNYLIYEPLIDNKLITGFPLQPPLDGSDSRIPIARSEDDLFQFIKEKKRIDISVYKEFANPNFDITFLKDIIK